VKREKEKRLIQQKRLERLHKQLLKEKAERMKTKLRLK